MLTEIIASILVLLGGLFVLIGSIGLVRLPDFFARLHAPTKATTLGVGSILLAALVHHAGGSGWRELAITLFLFITAPITAHLLAKTALAQARRRAAGKPDHEGST